VAAFEGDPAAAAGATFSTFAFGWRFSAAHLGALLFQDGLARQLDAIAFNGQHLHQDLIAFFQLVANIVDAVLGNFADVQQAIGAGDDFDECAEVGQPSYLA
jgi:hypothetical protein